MQTDVLFRGGENRPLSELRPLLALRVLGLGDALALDERGWPVRLVRVVKEEEATDLVFGENDLPRPDFLRSPGGRRRLARDLANSACSKRVPQSLLLPRRELDAPLLLLLGRLVHGAVVCTLLRPSGSERKVGFGSFGEGPDERGRRRMSEDRVECRGRILEEHARLELSPNCVRDVARRLASVHSGRRGERTAGKARQGQHGVAVGQIAPCASKRSASALQWRPCPFHHLAPSATSSDGKLSEVGGWR